jgi:hypothetical protein
MFGEHRFKRFEKALLVLFDRQHVLPALFIKDLPGRLHLSVRRIGQHDFTDDVQFGQLLARRWDFIAAFLDPG